MARARAVFALIALAACGGGGSAPPDGGPAPVDASATDAPSTDATADATADSAPPSDGGPDDPCERECAATDPWRCDACLPATLQEISAVVADGKIHVLGGFESTLAIVGTLRTYDPATDRWSEGPSLPDARHHIGFGALDGDLYAFGGMRDLGFEPLARSWVLRRGAGAWEEIAPLPKPRAAMAVGAIDGKLYIAAGQSTNEGATALENAAPTLVYDPATDEYTERAPIPTLREHVASFVSAGELWVIGGRPLTVSAPFTTVEIYDPSGDEWRAAPDTSVAHGGAAAAAWDGVGYVSGGEQSRTAEVPTGALDSVEAIDLGGGARWETRAPIPTPRHGHAMAAVNSRVYVIGGADEMIFAAVDVVESFAP